MDFYSEQFKPMMERIIGVGFKRVTEAETQVKNGEPIWKLEEACLQWWLSLSSLSDLFMHMSTSSKELSYCKMAMNNHKLAVSNMISEKIGYCPIMNRGEIPSNGWCKYELNRVTETKGELY
jgi:hypothetical protein